MGKRSKFGPGFLITAAFIGPGTVTSASLAGANFGFALLWVVVLSGLLTFLLQEMAGRFSLMEGKDLSSALVTTTGIKALNYAVAIVAVVAVVVGAAAYEAGNITGAFIGLDAIYPAGKAWAVLISLLAIIFLWRGRYRGIEVFLISLVALMSLAFVLTAVKAGPNLLAVGKGFVPRFPENSHNLALALLGTTVVPYNLFLYSSVVLKNWRSQDLPQMRKDLGVSILVGIIITGAILITSATAFFTSGIKINSAASMALQLKPLLGNFAKVSFCIGLFAAGLSSAITAPYAASWLLRGLFRFRENSPAFKITGIAVVLFGFSSLFFGLKPLHLIVMAQVANALILPFVVLFLGYSILSKTKDIKQFVVLFFSFSLVLIIVLARLF